MLSIAHNSLFACRSRRSVNSYKLFFWNGKKAERIIIAKVLFNRKR